MKDAIPNYGSPDYHALPNEKGGMKQEIFLQHYRNPNHLAQAVERFPRHAEPEIMMALYAADMNPQVSSPERYLEALPLKRLDYIKHTPALYVPQGAEHIGMLLNREYGVLRGSIPTLASSFSHVCSILDGHPELQEEVKGLLLNKDLGVTMVDPANDIPVLDECRAIVPGFTPPKPSQASLPESKANAR